ncbi:hypothetical protein YN1_1890 [Nanoarchaeota archaeon]
MVRIQVKEVEGVIAIVIFISFLTFYLAMYRSYITNRIDNFNQLNYYNTYLNQILNNIEAQYYLLSLNITIPISMYYQCSLGSPIYVNLLGYNAYNDFCTNFPIFYPLNISFLTNYSGVLNDTNNTYLDPNIGLYFYLNITNLTINNNQPQYVLINISNPTNNNIGPINLFITSPVIFYWLQNGNNLSVNKYNTFSVQFCYENGNFNCNSNNNGAYGIWLSDMYIPANSYIVLNISPSSNNNDAINGNNIFAYYNNSQIDSIFGQTNLNINYINPGYYLIIFNASTISNNGYIQFGNCNINIPNTIGFNYNFAYLCYLNQSTNSIIINNIDLNYIVILYYYSIVPEINVIYQPNITSTFNFIIGPNLTYNFSQYNDLGYNSNSIYNSHIEYNENLITSSGFYYSSLNFSNIYNNYILFSSLYTSQNEPYYLNSNYIVNDSLALLYLYSNNYLSIKKILFSNTYWFIINTEKYYDSTNMIYWNTNLPTYGFQGYYYINFYDIPLSLQFSLLNNYSFYPYENGILISNGVSNYAILFTNYNPIINLTDDNGECLETGQGCMLNLTLLNNYQYENYYLYFYYNRRIIDYSTAEYLSFSTQIPILKINYIEPINVININNLISISSNYPNIYFYFKNLNITIYNGTVYQGNIVNNYEYSQQYNVYILNNTVVNTLYKDKMIIYIK